MRGILFRPELIKAIVEGKKTQTRRVIKTDLHLLSEDVQKILKFSYYKVGEVVYIKEACWIPAEFSHSTVYYKLDWEYDKPSEMYNHNGKWRSPLFMPAWAARYFIKITDVRPERLQEISTKDKELMAEGISLICHPNNRTDWTEMAYQFSLLWDSINKNQKWETNPYIWRYEFKVVDGK